MFSLALPSEPRYQLQDRGLFRLIMISHPIPELCSFRVLVMPVQLICLPGNIPLGRTPPIVIIGTTTLHPEVAGIATIDGVQNNNYWAFSVGAGPGYLDLLDATGNVLMHQDITGYIQITSYQELGSQFNSDGNPNRNWLANGTFSITPIPTPEPGSGLLVGGGIFAALLFGRRKYAGSARSRCAQSVV